VSVPPDMMGAGPMLPPMAPQGMPMAPPAMPPMPEAPAAAALPGLAQLAQEQTMMIMDEQRRMMELQEKMQKDIMLLIASLPTPNPAGEAAVSTPMTPMMSGSPMSMPEDAAPMGDAPMGDATEAY